MQVDLCRTLIKEVSAKFGLEKEDKALIEAGVLARSGKTKEAVTALLGPDKKSTDLERILIASQIYLEKGEVAEALGVFQALPPEDKCRTGILSAMVTLCLALEDRAAAAKLLKEAVTYNKKGGKADGTKMVTVWRKAAEFHLKGLLLLYYCIVSYLNRLSLCQVMNQVWQHNRWKSFSRWTLEIAKHLPSWFWRIPSSISRRHWKSARDCRTSHMETWTWTAWRPEPSSERRAPQRRAE